MPRSTLSIVELQDLRRRAEGLLDAGFKQAEIARKLGVSRACVCRWARALEETGELRPLTNYGRPRRLSAEQVSIVETAMKEGPCAHSLGTSRWTGKSIAALIESLTGEVLDPDNARRLFTQLAGDRWRERPKRMRRRRRAAATE